MKTYTYDISALKKHFFYYVYRKQTRSMDEEQYEKYTKWPYFLLSEKIGGIFSLWLGIGFTSLSLLFIFEDISISFSSFGSIDYLIPLSLVFSIIAVLEVFWIRMYQRARKLEALDEYFRRKDACINALRELEQAIEIDTKETTLNPEHIEQIRKTINDTQSLTRLLLGPLSRFKEISNELDENQREVLNKFIESESWWLLGSIEQFQKLLTTWMNLHGHELEQLKNILKQSQRKEFNLALTGLEAQSAALEKVKIFL